MENLGPLLEPLQVRPRGAEAAGPGIRHPGYPAGPRVLPQTHGMQGGWCVWSRI